jgi:hypothetical protein
MKLRDDVNADEAPLEPFDAAERAKEKAEARAKDAHDLTTGAVTAEELRQKNGAFTAFAKAPMRLDEMLRRGR